MARASPASGSHPGNLLAAFFGAERACGAPSFREEPALPDAFPPRAGPRLLGGVLIAAMLHGVRVGTVVEAADICCARHRYHTHGHHAGSDIRRRKSNQSRRSA
jgi:hypothetical protein